MTIPVHLWPVFTPNPGGFGYGARVTIRILREMSEHVVCARRLAFFGSFCVVPGPREDGSQVLRQLGVTSCVI